MVETGRNHYDYVSQNFSFDVSQNFNFVRITKLVVDKFVRKTRMSKLVVEFSSPGFVSAGLLIYSSEINQYLKDLDRQLTSQKFHQTGAKMHYHQHRLAMGWKFERHRHNQLLCQYQVILRVINVRAPKIQENSRKFDFSLFYKVSPESPVLY